MTATPRRDGGSDQPRRIAAIETFLSVPQAPDWRVGTAIRCRSGRGADAVEAAKAVEGPVLCRVLEHTNRGSGIEPDFRILLGTGSGGGDEADETGTEAPPRVLGLARYRHRGLHPHWAIYLAPDTPPGRGPPSAAPDDANGGSDQAQATTQLRLSGVLYNTGVFERRHGNAPDSDAKVKYLYKSVRGGGWGCCGRSTRRVVEVTTPDGPARDRVAFVRDQFTEAMRVAPGEDLLLAAALAYCLDRRHAPLGSAEERRERVRAAKREAAVLGLRGAGGRPEAVQSTENHSEELPVITVQATWIGEHRAHHPAGHIHHHHHHLHPHHLGEA